MASLREMLANRKKDEAVVYDEKYFERLERRLANMNDDQLFEEGRKLWVEYVGGETFQDYLNFRYKECLSRKNNSKIWAELEAENKKLQHFGSPRYKLTTTLLSLIESYRSNPSDEVEAMLLADAVWEGSEFVEDFMGLKHYQYETELTDYLVGDDVQRRFRRLQRKHLKKWIVKQRYEYFNKWLYPPEMAEERSREIEEMKGGMR